MFKTNVGGLDRTLRVFVGALLIMLAFFGNRFGINIGWWGLIGIIPLATGFLSTCPLYSLLGMNTCKAS